VNSLGDAANISHNHRKAAVIMSSYIYERGECLMAVRPKPVRDLTGRKRGRILEYTEHLNLLRGETYPLPGP
jgi:hypothetical protein